MKNTFYLLISLLIIGCTSNPVTNVYEANVELLGAWHSVAPNGDEIIYNFKSKDTLTWEVRSEGGTFQTDAKYILNLDVVPNEIDIYSFSSPHVPTETIFFGIFKFQADDKLVFLGEPSKSGVSRRPSEFGEESLLFTKQ